MFFNRRKLKTIPNITKLPDEYDMDIHIIRKCINQVNHCPYCGNTKYKYAYQVDWSSSKYDIIISYKDDLIGFFNMRYKNKITAKCGTCGAEFESEPFITKDSISIKLAAQFPDKF